MPAANIQGLRMTPANPVSTPAAERAGPAPAGGHHDCGFGPRQRSRHGFGLVVSIVHHIGSRPGGHTAQQESFETSVVNDWAAILMPSAIVRYGAQLRETCSSVISPSRM